MDSESVVESLTTLDQLSSLLGLAIAQRKVGGGHSQDGKDEKLATDSGPDTGAVGGSITLSEDRAGEDTSDTSETDDEGAREGALGLTDDVVGLVG